MNENSINLNDIEPDNNTVDNYISKSAIKRQFHAYTQLGVALCKLNNTELARLKLDEKLYDEINLAQNIKSHSAQKRQRQYIGKLISRLPDSEIEHIQQQLEQLKLQAAQQQQQFHRLEQYREQLLSHGESAIQPLLEQYPQLDRQHLRQLLRNARKESEQNRPPKSSRLLFQYLRENIENTTG